eukprot:TRINITY_DN122619_c0_g1_i1.p2 TRINITY_DN122619_c0_g1~~TRINITY_DN122619_c0_g1_i1.p2  ORF type:complete len:283 (+),score=59.83 TRINITY_DN122619_c0_g1_i1:99-947(+)
MGNLASCPSCVMGHQATCLQKHRGDSCATLYALGAQRNAMPEQDAISAPAVCSKELRHTPRQEAVGVEGIPPPAPLQLRSGKVSPSGTPAWPGGSCGKLSAMAMMDGANTATPRAAAARTPAVRSPTVAAAANSQHLVEDLIQSLMDGKALCLLNSAGHSTECVACLDRKLATLILRFPGQPGRQTQSIPLQGITQIRVGERCGDKVAAQRPADELCVTILESDQAISFRFESTEQRDAFACCLSLFVVETPPLHEVLQEGLEMARGPPTRDRHAFMCGLCH